MKNAKILMYDGSFNGFLCCIYKAFDEKIQVADIQKKAVVQNGLFSDSETIFTTMNHAKSVWNGIQTKSHIAIRNIYFAFLSEQKGIEFILYKHIKKLFSPSYLLSLNFTDDLESRIVKLAKNVGKEKQHLEWSIQFKKTADAINFEIIKPAYDVLPLISRHFRFQMSNTPWVIYDCKRNYGLYYNLNSVEFISLKADEVHKNMNCTNLNLRALMMRKLPTPKLSKPTLRSEYSYSQAAV